jgi:hypothetical protein
MLKPGLATFVTLGVGLALAGLVYVGFASTQSPTPVNATAGERRAMTLAEDEVADRQLSWTSTLELAHEPDRYRLEVVLPYTVDPVEDGADGARVWTNLTVNGATASQHLLHAGGATVTLTYPGPRLDTEPFQAGANELSMEASIQRWASHEGTANLTMGPLVVEAHPVDADGDGIVDTEQPLAGLHTGALAAFAGLVLAAPTGYAVARWETEAGGSR